MTSHVICYLLHNQKQPVPLDTLVSTSEHRPCQPYEYEYSVHAGGHPKRKKGLTIFFEFHAPRLWILGAGGALVTGHSSLHAAADVRILLQVPSREISRYEEIKCVLSTRDLVPGTHTH